jgi:hypothetical protein
LNLGFGYIFSGFARDFDFSVPLFKTTNDKRLSGLYQSLSCFRKTFVLRIEVTSKAERQSPN